MDTFLSVLQGILGVGLLVFLHELGHFVAARLCRVEVLVFSLGFGPRLWGFERDGCDYRISWVPVGGYVRMVGDIGAEDEPCEGSLATKPPLQRIFVYSAGVLMNALLALALFPVVYAMGLPISRPVVGSTVPGSPAWQAGLKPGTVIQSVNGVPIRSFDELNMEVAVAASPIRLAIDEPVPGNPALRTQRTVEIASPASASDSKPRLGIEQGAKLVPAQVDGSARLGFEVEVDPETQAYKSGLRSGDLLVEIDGRAAEARWQDRVLEKWLPLDAPLPVRFVPGPSSPQRTPEELASLAALKSLPLGKPSEAQERPRVGVFRARTTVIGVREHPALAAAELRPGDRIVEIAGAPASSPSQLLETLSRDGVALLSIVREGAWRTATVVARPGEAASIVDAIALDAPDALARLAVPKGSPADQGGIQSGDRVVRVDDREIRDWSEFESAVASSAGAPLQITVERERAAGTERHTVEIRPQMRPVSLSLGFHPVQDRSLVRATGPMEAVSLGFASSLKLTKQILVILKKLVLGEIAARKTVGGPISIAAVTIQSAQAGFVYFLLLLATLSINLAILNLLPVPMLDGGNLFFVILEAIKGSPVSERVLGTSQTIGLFLLVALMLWVTFHDIRNVFGLFS